ncbi:MAG TPA: hypothetical protein VKX40_05785 [Aequorivita sp.]|nr:hypothetical protein [Aequorivita sp.]
MKKSFVILFVFVVGMAVAQIPRESGLLDISAFPMEKTDLFVNADLLLAGEALHYKTFVQDGQGKTSTLSKTAYVSLRNQNDSIIFTHKLQLINGVANGDFFLPSTLKTGVYKLIAYTNFSRNNVKDAFSQKAILLINPFVRTVKSASSENEINLTLTSEELPNPFDSEGTSVNIKLITDKFTYGVREKVKLTVENITGKNQGNYVLSVRKIEPVIAEIPASRNNAISSDLAFLPELRGELISGVVLSGEKVPVANQVLSLTIPGKDYVFKMAKTDRHGRFYFSVDEAYQAENAVIQLNEEGLESKDFQIIINEKRFDLSKGAPSNLNLDPSLKKWVLERSVQLQIENAYFEAKRDSVFPPRLAPKFYDHLGKLFVLDDFTRFPSVRETFVEIISLAAIRGVGGSTRFLVNNEYDPKGLAKFSKIDPLVLLDGFQVLNNSELINYNARDIKSIRVVNQPYRYGPKLFSGIIAVETKQGDFIPLDLDGYSKTFKISPVERRKQYYSPTYNNSNVLSRIPDYRVQLLWQPELKNEQSGFISFYTSDVSGVFQISLEGFTDEGVPISVKQFFKVKYE